jgi:hypothetical protein
MIDTHISREGLSVNLFGLIIVILLLMAFGLLPQWGYLPTAIGYRGTGGLGTLIIILIILRLLNIL